MYSLFSKNNASGALLVAVLLVLLRIRLFIDPARYVVSGAPDVFSPLWQSLFGAVEQGSVLSASLAVVLTLACAMVANNIVNRYGLEPSQSLLGGMSFVLFSGALCPALNFQPVLVFALTLLVAVHRLFSAVRKERPYRAVAWAFALVAVGSLFWTRGWVFLPALFVALPSLRLGGPRQLLAALMGVMAVCLPAATVVLCGSDPLAVAHGFVSSAWGALPLWKVGPWSISYLVVWWGLITVAAVAVYSRGSDQMIVSGRMLRFAVWIALFASVITLLPGYSYEMQSVVAVGASLLLPRYLTLNRQPMLREGAPALLLLCTAVLIYI